MKRMKSVVICMNDNNAPVPLCQVITLQITARKNWQF